MHCGIPSTQFDKSLHREILIFPEKIFGIGGYICKLCTTINPVIFTFSSQLQARISNFLAVPCDHRYDPVDRITLTKRLYENGLIEPLLNWIQDFWSCKPMFIVESFRIPDPRITYQSGKLIINRKFHLTLGLSEGTSTKSKSTKAIHFIYDDTLVEDMFTSFGKDCAWVQSCDQTDQIISNAIDNGVILLDSKVKLTCYLAATKFRTFGFFRPSKICNREEDDQIYVNLVVLVPTEFAKN